MFTHRYPQFQKGRILKSDMLDSLRDIPKHTLELVFGGCSDGILAGADICVEQNLLLVDKGIVKRDGKLYLLTEPWETVCEATGRDTILKLRFMEEEAWGDFVTGEGLVVLEEGLEVADHEIELARFKLKPGARLRGRYQSFADMGTEFNTLNIIHACHAGPGSPTLAPKLLQYYASELLQTGTSNPHDIAFAMQCLNQTRISRETILLYVSCRLGNSRQELGNLQLHRLLVRILEEAGHGGAGRGQELKRGGPHRMLVD